MIKMSSDGWNDEDQRCMKVMTWNDVDGLTKKNLDQDVFLLFLKCFDFFWIFYVF